MPTTPYPERLGVPRPDMERAAERYRYGELKLILEKAMAPSPEVTMDEELQHRLDLVHDRSATAERWAVN